MSRLIVAVGLCTWVGATLLLADRRWFRREPLLDRLAPHQPGFAPQRTNGRPSAASLREVLAPMAQAVGSRLSKLVGVHEDLERRLWRLHSPLDVSDFRLRQFAWTAAGLATAVTVASALRLPPPVTVLLLFAGPAVSFLVVEQRLSAASARRQRRLFLELPVVSEQLGMLLSAGFSLGSALHRLAVRNDGVTGADLARVIMRVRQGLSEAEALREWSAAAGVPALERLVAVLDLNSEAADLGRLTADEARSIRRDVQRELIESIERRNQQVWIPVTVAALLPGALFIAIPFLDAVSAFSTG